ncbi:MAG: ROK family transcriptional regulator [Bacillota bacterium]
MTKKGKNNTNIQIENRSTLLKYLKDNEGVCRKDLAEISGLTKATITNIVKDLINLNIIQEGPRNGNAISLKINDKDFLIISIVFRRGKIKHGVTNLKGKFLEKNEIKLKLDEPVKKVIKKLNNIVDNYLDRYSTLFKIVGLGLALPGPINLKKGEITHLTNLPGWDTVKFQDFFDDKYEFPIIVDEVANATVYAEKWFGKAKNYKNFLSLIVSKGVGSGIMADNNIYHGEKGFAGEIGHMSINFDGPKCECGNNGCLEMYCSTLILIEKINSLLGNGKIKNLDEISKYLKNKEVVALIKNNGKKLGYGLINLINVFNPKFIIIHSDMKMFGDLWLSEIRKVIKERSNPTVSCLPEIEYSDIDTPTLLGSSAMVANHIMENPDDKYF